VSGQAFGELDDLPAPESVVACEVEGLGCGRAPYRAGGADGTLAESGGQRSAATLLAVSALVERPECGLAVLIAGWLPRREFTIEPRFNPHRHKRGLPALCAVSGSTTGFDLIVAGSWLSHWEQGPGLRTVTDAFFRSLLTPWL
jgi:hypothetical protein